MLIRPDYYFDKITDIPVSLFRENSIKYLLIDIDNTLSIHHGQTEIDGLDIWLKKINDADITPVLVSNSTEKRVNPFSKKIKIDYVSLSLKPLPVGYLKAKKLIKFDKKHTATIGDQLFTDVLGGNLYGVTTILLKPILPEKSIRFRIKRYIEKKVLKYIL